MVEELGVVPADISSPPGQRKMFSSAAKTFVVGGTALADADLEQLA